MRFGICASSRYWKELAEIGYDYIEMALSYLTTVDDTKLQSMLAIQKETGIRVESCNNFFPSDFKLYAIREDGSEDVEGFRQIEENVRTYVKNAFAIASRLGVVVTVLGSSGARTIPEGVSREVAESQFLRLLRICGEIGEAYGITVTVEPLNYGETNFINTVADGLAFVRNASHPSIRAMVDFYHHAYNNEPMEILEEARGVLAHVHLARIGDRTNPTLADEAEVRTRIDALRAIGYDSRVTLECSFGEEFIPHAKDSYLLLKKFK